MGMFKAKKGAMLVKGLIVVLVLVGLLAVADKFGGTQFLSAAPAGSSGSAPTGAATAAAQAACNVEDVSLRYNDLNFYAKGTDPAGNLVITAGDVPPQSVADDGSLTVATFSQVKGYANSSAYFNVEVDENVGCSDPYDLVPVMKATGTPTLTMLGDDGVTKITSSAAEAMGASSEFTETVSVRAPNDACAWGDKGAIVAVEYDATYFSSFDSNLPNGNQAVFITHNSSGETQQNAGLDQWATFKVEGSLCDSEKMDIVLTAKTSSTQPTTDTNPVVWILPLDIDRDEGTFDLITGIYDEDNNLIAPTTHNITMFVS